MIDQFTINIMNLVHKKLNGRKNFITDKEMSEVFCKMFGSPSITDQVNIDICVDEGFLEKTTKDGIIGYNVLKYPEKVLEQMELDAKKLISRFLNEEDIGQKVKSGEAFSSNNIPAEYREDCINAAEFLSDREILKRTSKQFDYIIPDIDIFK